MRRILVLLATLAIGAAALAALWIFQRDVKSHRFIDRYWTVGNPVRTRFNPLRTKAVAAAAFSCAMASVSA